MIPAQTRRENLLSVLLVLPAFLYLTGLLVSGYGDWDGGSIVGFIAIPLLLAIGLLPLYGPLLEIFGFVVVGVAALGEIFLVPASAGGLDFPAGILLSSPLMIGAWAWTPGRSAPGKLVGLGLALTDGLMLLSALHLIAANGQVEDPATLFTYYTLSNALQVCGLAGLLNVGTVCAPMLPVTQFPLRDIVDPVFVLLSSLALLGVLVPILSPRTARGAAGEAEGFDDFEQTAQLRTDLPVSPELVRALAGRTPPRPSPGLAPPGSSALLLSVLLTLAFVVWAINAPTTLLLPLLLLVLGSLVTLLALGRSARPALPVAPPAPVPFPSGVPGGRAPGALGPVPLGLPAPAGPTVVLP